MTGIFKKNDIRGIYGSELTEELARKIASSFVTFCRLNAVKLNAVSIAGDSRISTRTLKDAMIDGFLNAGVDVYDLGLGPSPMIYYSAATNPTIDAGVMITASHNPKEYNGIKICDSTGASYHYDNLYEWIENSLDQVDENHSSGTLYSGDSIKDRYFNRLINKIKLNNPLRLVVEVGNGSTGEFIPYLKKMGCDVVGLHQHPDGTFPVLLPDPTRSASFEYIQKQDGYDLGIVFDGDGDRVGFCTANGEIITPDKVIMLFARGILERKSADIIIDVKISKATADYIAELGGDAILCRVGHSWIHEKIIEEEAPFAGELSGHYYFNDQYYGFDDGLYSAVRFLQILDNFISDGVILNEYVESLPTYFATKEYRVNIDHDTQERILDQLRRYTESNKGRIITIDGVRGEFNDGWFIARSSSTEEKLSYRVEGQNEESRNRILNDIQKIITNLCA